jgi:ectoine hydroxylase-related dioxygenase (phytanoyl-CoA dioxygenase family)
MNNYWAFLPMRASNDLLGNPTALRERLDEDSYLYFEKVLDDRRINALRKAMLLILAERKWVVRHPLLMQGAAIAPPAREGDDEYFEVYDEIQRLEEFHTLAHDADLMAIMRQVVGERAFPHPLKIARLSFPANYEISTPPHQDYPNNQGTTNLTAASIPVGNIPKELGGIAVLRGSHRFGALPLEPHAGAGNRQAVLPQRMLEELRWVTTEYSAGDVLLFPALTVHASMHNASEFFMRISVDYRYQTEGEELTEGVLQPHFQRLTWEQIYADWKSDRFQYYWKNLDYKVVPFETFALGDSPFEREDADVRAFMAYQRRLDARFQRRTERLAALIDPEGNSESQS